jgi:hypothetical protein
VPGCGWTAAEFEPATATSALAICGDRVWAAYAFEVEVATAPLDVWGGWCWTAAAFGVGSGTAWNALFDCESQPAKLAQLRAMKVVARTLAPARLPTKKPHDSTKKCLQFAIIPGLPPKGNCGGGSRGAIL